MWKLFLKNATLLTDMSSLLKKVILLVILYFVLINNVEKKSCTASVPIHKATEHIFTTSELLQEKFDNSQSSHDQTLVVRLPSNSLLKYTSYKDVSILHFKVPPDTHRAIFTFKAFEESKSAFQRKCQPRDVSLYLKATSYPVISPENITFPKNFLNTDLRFHTYSLQFLSNDVQQKVAITGPQIGNWFAVAFVSWTDPNNERIEQQGLGVSCDTLLMAEMAISRLKPIITNNGQIHIGSLTGNNKLHNESKSKENSIPRNYGQKLNSSRNIDFENRTANNEILYKFFVPENIEAAIARITVSEGCTHCPDVAFLIQANAYPHFTKMEYISFENNYLYSTLIKPNKLGHISFEFFVQPNAWHYAVLKFINSSNTSNFANTKYFKHKRQVPKPRLPERVSTIWYNFTYTMQINYINQKKSERKIHRSVLNVNQSAHDESKFTNNFDGIKDPWQPVLFRGIEFYPLLRQSYREFFMFDYDLLPDVNGTVPAVVNLTAGRPAGFMFSVNDISDIGGTLSFSVSMKHGSWSNNELKTKTSITTNERGGILAEKLVGHLKNDDIENENTNSSKNDYIKGYSRSNQTIIVCLHLNEPLEPLWPDKCRHPRFSAVGDKEYVIPAAAIVNNTDSNTSIGIVHAPFPESGQWFATMGLYCHGAETAAKITIIDSVKEFAKKYTNILDGVKAPCPCAQEAEYYLKCLKNTTCLANMNETETLKVKECLTDFKCTSDYVEMTYRFNLHHKLATEQHFALDNCNSSVEFTVSSSPCVAGRCGRFGRCYHYMSGGFVFSTCVCMKGYRGWDCTEDSQVPSSLSILVASLLLIFSNLLFIPSIYVAVRRKYYAEAVIYFFSMFFSIFYHACDSGEDEYSFCLVKIGVLQFCDFYCGLLAIWVTLVAMSNIRSQFVSLLHMVGAIMLAFGTELNKQSLWVFLAPALIGVCLITVSWGLRCRKSNKIFPARKYLTVYMPLGIVLVMIGLVCYAFLQTRKNYHIVHSTWHILMALSILCLLPCKSFLPKC